jgi:hypothetical protein
MSFPYLQYWMFVAFNVLAGMGILAIIQAVVRGLVGAPGRSVPPAGGGDRPAPVRPRSGAGRHAAGRDELDVLADGYQAGQNTGDLPAVRTDAAAYAGSGERLGSIRIPGYAQYQPSYAQNGADLGMGSHPLEDQGAPIHPDSWYEDDYPPGQDTDPEVGEYGEGVPPGLMTGIDL